MGFTPKRRVYLLDFTGDDELDGLEVKARSAPIGMMMELGGLIEAAAGMADPAAAEALPEAEKTELIRRALGPFKTMVQTFAQVLVEWNLDDDQGRPVPADVEGLKTLDPAHMMRITRAWHRAVAEAPEALGKASSGGSPSPEASLPMDVVSPSLAS